MASVLEVQDLHVSYLSREGTELQALAGAGFALQQGEILGVLGESGSGKSTLAAALVKLLPPSGRVTKGVVLFEGQDLLQSTSQELRRIRGARMALIFQEPSLALHPTMRVGEQVRQVLAAHSPACNDALRERTQEAFAMLFSGDADRVSRSYPHQLSGGQRQRVLIAQAIACHPSVIIADEPTASLDPTTQMEILGVFRTLQKKLGLAMIFITHNPALLAGFADRVLVLYGGRVIECGPAEAVLASPQHPYTKALFQSIPADLEYGGNACKTKLPAIPGDAFSLPQEGCSFEPRCTERMDTCQERKPALVNFTATHRVSCFRCEK